MSGEQKPIGNTKEELKESGLYGCGSDILPITSKQATHATTYSESKGKKNTLIGRGE